MENNDNKIAWRAPAYDFREKTPDWFWAVGIIALSLAIGSIVIKNYLFAIFIIIAVAILVFYSVRRPEEIDYEVNSRGIKIKDAFYGYKELSNFWIDRHHETKKILIHTNRVTAPLLDIPLPSETDEEKITDLLSASLKEEEIKEPLSHKIMDYLGF